MLIPTFGAYNWRASINPSKSVGPRGRTLGLGSAHFLLGCTACDLDNSSAVSTVVFFQRPMWLFWTPVENLLVASQCLQAKLRKAQSTPGAWVLLTTIFLSTSRCILQCTPCLLFASIMHTPRPVFFGTCHAVLVPSPGICSSWLGWIPLEYTWWSPTYPLGPIHLFFEATMTPSLSTHTWYGGPWLLGPTMSPCHCSSQHIEVHLFVYMFARLL